mgnify:CR=1 FL=1
MEIIAQAIGFVAVIVTVSSFQIDNRKTILLLLMVSSSLYSIHFLLLGALTGSALNAINIARNYIFAQKYEYKWANSRLWLLFFIVVFIFAGILTWDGLKTILPVVGMIAGVIAFWMKNTTHIRLLALIAPPCWFIYNFIVGSYPGMVVEVFTVTSIIIAVIRYDILKQKSAKK